jgi:hypothetical protein
LHALGNSPTSVKRIMGEHDELARPPDTLCQHVLQNSSLEQPLIDAFDDMKEPAEYTAAHFDAASYLVRAAGTFPFTLVDIPLLAFLTGGADLGALRPAAAAKVASNEEVAAPAAGAASTGNL